MNAAGERTRKKIDPDPPEPRERYVVARRQFDSWIGEPLKVYKARLAEGYSFELRIEEQVPAYKSEGWEHMLIKDQELWWRDPTTFALSAFLIRK